MNAICKPSEFERRLINVKINVKEVLKVTEEAKQARAAYMREWRANNPEKEKAARARYWERRAEREREAEREQRRA